MVESDVMAIACSAGSLSIVHAVRSDGFAGVERYVATVADELAKRQHRVTVIGGDPVAMRNVIANRAVTVVPGATTSRVARELARHARGVDIVHVHMTAAETAALVAWPLVRKPTIATRHFASRRGSTIARRTVAPLIRRMLVTEIAISDFVARASGPGVRTLRNGVPIDDPVDPAKPVVLVAQRLAPEKNTGEALEAWVRSGLGARGWELWIAGDGGDRPGLEAQAAALDAVGVRFLGRREDMKCLRASAGMFLAPAPAEPFGLSVAEAMACGLPVVAAAGGGHLETVARATPDCVYPPGDVVRCAELLAGLASDVARRRQIGASLQAFQRQALTLDAHIDGLVGIYRTYAPGTARRPSTA